MQFLSLANVTKPLNPSARYQLRVNEDSPRHNYKQLPLEKVFLKPGGHCYTLPIAAAKYQHWQILVADNLAVRRGGFNIGAQEDPYTQLAAAIVTQSS